MPLIAPPVIATLLAFWVAMVPRPRAVTVFCTNAVDAACVVLVPLEAVGTVGVPVNVGLTEEIAPENTAVVPVIAPCSVVVPVTVKLPFTMRLLEVPTCML